MVTYHGYDCGYKEHRGVCCYVVLPSTMLDV